MKTTLSLCLALLAATSARAQIFRPEAVNGAVLGGIAGAVIGNNSGDLRHNAWKGAALGAGAGLLLGEAVGNANAASRNTQVGSPAFGDARYRSTPVVQVGVGYGRGGYGYGHGGYGGYRGHPGYGYGYGSYGPRYSTGYWPTYSYYGSYGADYPYYDTYGSYGPTSGAANGLVLGALAGGIIGNNSGSLHHSGWRGAAWGAGLGWLLGSVADANRRSAVYSAPAVVQPSAPVQVQNQPATAPQQPVTIINNYYNTSTPMSGANGLFGR